MSADNGQIVQQQRNGGYKGIQPRWKPGESGNPGGRAKGTPSIPHIIARLLAMSAADWQSFEPENAAEIIALQAIKDAARSTFIDPAAVKSREFIVDRLHGKPVQRRTDVTEDDVISRAKMGYALLTRCAERIIEKYPLIEITENEILTDVLAGIDPEYHSIVCQAFES